MREKAKKVNDSESFLEVFVCASVTCHWYVMWFWSWRLRKNNKHTFANWIIAKWTTREQICVSDLPSDDLALRLFIWRHIWTKFNWQQRLRATKHIHSHIEPTISRIFRSICRLKWAIWIGYTRHFAHLCVFFWSATFKTNDRCAPFHSQCKNP